MIIFLICAFALVTVFGMFNYVIALLRAKGRIFNPKIYVVAWILSLYWMSFVALLLGVLLLRNPQFVFANVHWGWVFASGIVMTVILLAVGIAWLLTKYPTYVGSIQILLGVCVATMMVLGLVQVPKTTYYISNPKDLNLLNNLPTSIFINSREEAYYIEVTNNIDFKGFELEETYGNGANYLIDGKGHTWKNLNYECNISSFEQTVFALYSDRDDAAKSQIRNLSVKKSKFYVTPDYYGKESHTGKGCDFFLFPDSLDVKNVRINATVCVKATAVDDVRYEAKSYLEKVYPTKSFGNNDIVIDVIEEKTK